ncbi:MAG: hypothetical protein LM590_09065 [Thermofilum sp.]|nr:hypothetical protein [Thermofilum sp.]
MLEFIVLLGTIISSSASLGYWLAGRISSLETGVSRLEQDFSSLRQDLSSLREDVYSLRSAVGRLDEGVKTLKIGVLGFNELLLEVLREKGFEGVHSHLSVQVLHGGGEEKADRDPGQEPR